MSSARFGLGWKRDRDEHILATPKSSRLECLERFGAGDLPADCLTLKPFCLVRNQLKSSACTGFAFSGTIYARLHALGIQCPVLSALDPYAGARQLAGDREPLPDEGAIPYLVVSFLASFGITYETDMPFDPANYLDSVKKEVDFLTFEKNAQFKVKSFSRIEGEDDHIMDATMRALASNCPVPIGMDVGSAFENYSKGSAPVDVEDEKTILGGHMTFLVGYEDNGEVLVGCNSWDTDYGDEGFYRITRAKYLSSQTSDRYLLSLRAAA